MTDAEYMGFPRPPDEPRALFRWSVAGGSLIAEGSDEAVRRYVGVLLDDALPITLRWEPGPAEQAVDVTAEMRADMLADDWRVWARPDTAELP